MLMLMTVPGPEKGRQILGRAVQGVYGSIQDVVDCSRAWEGSPDNRKGSTGSLQGISDCSRAWEGSPGTM